jgi:pSer/pThr/pTyr-binding forkhead associated (FHA) protein
MDSGRIPTPRPMALPDCLGRRPKPDSEYPQPLGEAIELTTPAGDHTLTAERVIIGRAPTCEVIISDPLVSREHALIRIGPQQVFIEDLGSSNGVYVNNVRITEPHQLCDGDRILVGTQELCVFAATSRRLPTSVRLAVIRRSDRSGDPVPSTERLDPGAVLVRAAEHLLEQGAAREAEQMLVDSLNKTLEAARKGHALPPTVCADAARRALALATALGEGSWFDYAVELHFQAGLGMSIETAGALAEAAVAVSGVDRALLGRYLAWLHTSAPSSAEEPEVVVRFLESVHWPGA